MGREGVALAISHLLGVPLLPRANEEYRAVVVRSRRQRRMASKVAAAIATGASVPVLLRAAAEITRELAGRTGTCFHPTGKRAPQLGGARDRAGVLSGYPYDGWCRRRAGRYREQLRQG